MRTLTFQEHFSEKEFYELVQEVKTLEQTETVEEITNLVKNELLSLLSSFYFYNILMLFK